MGKNITGGKKHKRGKNIVIDLKLVVADYDCQFYSKVITKLGGCRYSVDMFITEKKNEENKIIRCEEVKKDQIALLRGSLKKRARIVVGDILLVSIREFEERKVDIIHAYKNEEVHNLRRKNKLPKSNIFDNDDSDVNFFNIDNDNNNNNDNNDNDEDLSYSEIKKDSSYTSNYDLIPTMDSDNEIDNI